MVLVSPFEKATYSIVGGYGKMGSCLARLLKGEVPNVIICGRRIDAAMKVANEVGVSFASIEEAVSKANVCILSIPVDKTYGVGMQVSRYMKDGSILIDIASVKTGVTDRLDRDLPSSIKYVSIHPLFGPTVRSLRNRNIVIIRKERNADVALHLSKFFEEKGATTIFLTIEEHDRLMASIQALHHFVLLTFYKFLEQQMGKPQLLKKSATESLKLTLRSINRILRNINAVEEIRKFNPYARKAINDYIRYMMEVCSFELTDTVS